MKACENYIMIMVQLESEINCKEAKPHGAVRFYFDNDILKSEANYKMDISHGIL